MHADEVVVAEPVTYDAEQASRLPGVVRVTAGATQRHVESPGVRDRTTRGTEVASRAEQAAMRRAIELARRPGGTLGSNPRVGCVVLTTEGESVAEGYHRGPGTAHAEIDALRQAGGRASGATVVVTLEPCHHTGRTGPCTRALVDAGVRRVVYAAADLNPTAAGGAQALTAAGVDVEAGVLADEAAAVNEAWSFAMLHQRPFVTWKFATTADGRAAAADGTSRWITGPEARSDVHLRRAMCDTILVGTGTVIADNPRLTVRDADGSPLPAGLQPLRAVMGLTGVDSVAAVLDDAAETVLLSTRDPSQALKELFALDRRHVWLEGGPTLAAAFAAAGLVDEVIAYVAPALLGAGLNAVADLGIATIDAALRYELRDVTRLGDDVRLVMRGVG